MAIEHIFDSASRVMTVVSFITFAGIWVWAWSARKQKDFSEAAQLPFMEKDREKDEEKQNV